MFQRSLCLGPTVVKAEDDVDEGDDDVFEEVTESPKKTQTKRRSQSLSALKDEKQPRKVGHKTCLEKSNPSS